MLYDQLHKILVEWILRPVLDLSLFVFVYAFMYASISVFICLYEFVKCESASWVFIVTIKEKDGNIYQIKRKSIINLLLKNAKIAVLLKLFNFLYFSVSW